MAAHSSENWLMWAPFRIYVSRTWFVILIVLSAILAITSTALAILLYRQPHFIETKSSNPYVMFDTRSGQVCWAGPTNLPKASDGPGKLLFNAGPAPNQPSSGKDNIIDDIVNGKEAKPLSAQMPACKDL